MDLTPVDGHNRWQEHGVAKQAQLKPIFPGLDLCLHVRLDLDFWCLSWRGLANTWWPAKACWPAGRTLARDFERRWHEWQSW